MINRIVSTEKKRNRIHLIQDTGNVWHPGGPSKEGPADICGSGTKVSHNERSGIYLCERSKHVYERVPEVLDKKGEFSWTEIVSRDF